MRPTRRLLWLLGAWVCLALGLAYARVTDLDGLHLEILWYTLGAAIAVVSIVDVSLAGGTKKLELKRAIHHTLALGRTIEVETTLHNPTQHTIVLTLAAPPCPKCVIYGLPVSFLLPPGQRKKLIYSLKPIARGDAQLAPLRARIDTRLGLWQTQVDLGNTDDIRIFPNFSPINSLAALGVEQRVQQLGVHLSQRRGEGMEFKQLREFVEGDTLRQIDWKSTSRYRKPISREYQDERNQDIFFLLDCGRRLRQKDDELSHFDHALNAILLTAYIAINQGDAAGFASFAGAQRWLNPAQGKAGLTRLMNLLYDLECTTQTSDFLQIAQDFQNRHRRRSLVILVSNVREEDEDDLLQAAHLLSKNHVVMVASLQESFLQQQLNHPVSGFNEALTFAGTHQYLQSRKRLQTLLTSRGVIVVDTPPQKLHIALVDHYFRLKRSHRL